jgi:hypothetical protein
MVKGIRSGSFLNPGANIQGPAPVPVASIAFEANKGKMMPGSSRAVSYTAGKLWAFLQPEANLRFLPLYGHRYSRCSTIGD